MKLRVILAIAACKGLRLLARLLHRGGTAKPGEIALKLCPELLRVLSRNVETVVVTGTNGKTTSCRMLEEAFTRAGFDCIANRSGANLMSGITTEFVMASSLLGKCRKRYAVMECDEAWTRKVLPALEPRVFLVTNLFRDQVDRYGDVSNTLAAIAAGVAASPRTTLCLNADDAITATLGRNVPNPVIWYGFDANAAQTGVQPGPAEVTSCMCCGAALEYDYVSYAHLGGFHCPNCGYQRPEETAVAVAGIEAMDPDSSRVTLRLFGEECQATVGLPAQYNIYNAIGALAAASAAGVPSELALAAVGDFNCGFGRMEKFDVGAGVRMVLVKNAAGVNQVLDFLDRQQTPFQMVFITNNRVSDGTDISWIGDADFERLAGMDALEHVTLSGLCAGEMEVRLLQAGLPEDKLSRQPDYAALAQALAAAEVPCFILPSYTGMMEFRPYLIKRTGGKEFWE